MLGGQDSSIATHSPSTITRCWIDHRDTALHPTPCRFPHSQAALGPRLRSPRPAPGPPPRAPVLSGPGPLRPPSGNPLVLLKPHRRPPAAPLGENRKDVFVQTGCPHGEAAPSHHTVNISSCPFVSGCPACSGNTCAFEWQPLPLPLFLHPRDLPQGVGSPTSEAPGFPSLQWNSEVRLGGNVLPSDVEPLNQQALAFRDQRQNICPWAPGGTAWARTAGPEPPLARSSRTGGQGWVGLLFVWGLGP